MRRFKQWLSNLLNPVIFANGYYAGIREGRASAYREMTKRVDALMSWELDELDSWQERQGQ